MSLATKIYRARIIHSLSPTELQIIEKGAIGVCPDGVIKFVVDEATHPIPNKGTKAVGSPRAKRARTEGGVSHFPSGFHGEVGELIADTFDVVEYPKRFIVPGLVDTHAHAAQYSNAGLGLDMPLLEWLEAYTFPTEAKFSKNEFAEQVYSRSVRRHLKNGTTTIAFYSSIHVSAAKVLADVIEKAGMRAFIGKVNMDRNSPDFYIEDTDASIAATTTFIKDILGRKCSRLTPIVTPRFVPTCTEKLMRALGDIAKTHNLPIQTHISENKSEVGWVKGLHPDCTSYADVYDKHGLLTEKTILGHGVYLTPEEVALIKSRGAAVSHCPVSNFDLESGVLDVRSLLTAGVKVGLGTDVSGGHSASMQEVIRATLTASKATTFNNDKLKTLTYAEAFYLATVGGAAVLGLGETVGNFVAGKRFDALVINTRTPDGPIDNFDGETASEEFQKWIYLGDDRTVEHIYVDGRHLKV